MMNLGNIKDEELKPCPFCGCKNPKHETGNHCNIIRCYWCGLFVGDFLSGDLVDKWNRRVSE